MRRMKNKNALLEIENVLFRERKWQIIDNEKEKLKQFLGTDQSKELIHNKPENLLEFVTILQEELIRAGILPPDYDFEAHKELVPMQPGDVPVTYADTSALEADFGFKPSTPLRTGLRAFAEWYADYYHPSKTK